MHETVLFESNANVKIAKWLFDLSLNVFVGVLNIKMFACLFQCK
jgi:hypothetical protein